jgi:RHS repeat-associated protein
LAAASQGHRCRRSGGNDPVEKHYVYFGDNIVLQFDETTTSHTAICMVRGGPDSGRWTTPTTFLAPCRPQARFATAGNDSDIVNHIEYGTFGNVTAETNAAIDLIFGYTGRERDEETGLMYYRARYYDPTVGRFVSHDPIGFVAGDANLSRYVANSTPNHNDPFGLEEAGSGIWTSIPVGAHMELQALVFAPMPMPAADTTVKPPFSTIKEVEDELKKSPQAAKLLSDLKEKGLEVVIDTTLPGGVGANRARYDIYGNDGVGIIRLNNEAIRTLSGAAGYLLYELIRAQNRAEQVTLDNQVKDGTIKSAKEYADKCEALTFKYTVELVKIATDAMKNHGWGPKGDIGWGPVLATIDTPEEWIEYAKKSGHYDVYIDIYGTIKKMQPEK